MPTIYTHGIVGLGGVLWLWPFSDHRFGPGGTDSGRRHRFRMAESLVQPLVYRGIIPMSRFLSFYVLGLLCWCSATSPVLAQGYSPQEAVNHMMVPPGFQVQLVAS